MCLITTEFATEFQNRMFLYRLAFLADLFDKVNDTNLSLQGKNKLVYDMHGVITGLQRKLKVWFQRVSAVCR